MKLDMRMKSVTLMLIALLVAGMFVGIQASFDAEVSRARNLQYFEMTPQTHPPGDANVSRQRNLQYPEMTPQAHPQGDANVSRLRNLQLLEMVPHRWKGTIYIRADGSMYPLTAPIQRDGDLYTLRGNIEGDYDGIVIERDNMTLDGAGYTVFGVGWAGTGITLSGRHNVSIIGIQIGGGFGYGVILGNSFFNAIHRNIITGNPGHGILLEDSSVNRITENIITNNGRGLELMRSSNNTIAQNQVSNGTEAIALSGPSNHNVISGNIIANNSRHGILFMSFATGAPSFNSISENRVEDNLLEGILLVESSYNLLSGNSIVNNRNGIWVYGSYNNVSANIIASNADYGLCISQAEWWPGNYVSNNLLTENAVGIGVEGNNNSISANTLSENTQGIYVDGSENRIHHNNFMDNSMQAWDSQQNSWDDDYPSGGNYWSDYIGDDLYSGSFQNQTRSDGIGDTPFEIATNSSDNYPLVFPYETISLLDPAFNEAFQLSLEPSTGMWGVPNVEYRLVLRSVVRWGTEVIGLFDPTAAADIAGGVWNLITADIDGNGKIEDWEYDEVLQTLAERVNQKLMMLSWMKNPEFWTATYAVLIERLASIAPFAFAGSIVVAAIINPYTVSTMINPALICGGVWSSSSSSLYGVSVLSGNYWNIGYYSPVGLEVITSSGQVLNSTVNQIPGATYVFRDFDEDGQLDGKVILPNNTQGYTFRVIPIEGADPLDNYTLTVGADWYQLTLLRDAKIQNISATGYLLEAFNHTSLEEIAEQILNQEWKPSFIGLDRYPIVGFEILDGVLYAAANNVLYKYDGGNWSVIHAPTYMTSLEAYSNKLIVGGQKGLYSFNQTSFDLIFSVHTYIRVLGAFDGKLYAGTFLDRPPTLYYCNGTPEDPNNWQIDANFSAVLNFSGPFGSIDSFAVYNSKLYITSERTVYSYNRTHWSMAKAYDDVYAYLDMEVYNGKLYLATRDQAWRKPYYQGGTGFSGRVIEFDGINWTTVFDHDYWIFSLEIYDNKLFVGTANKIYTYDGANWNTSFNAVEGAFYAISLITFNDNIYVGMGNGYILIDPASEVKPETTMIPELCSTAFLVLFLILSMFAAAFAKRFFYKH